MAEGSKEPGDAAAGVAASGGGSGGGSSPSRRPVCAAHCGVSGLLQHLGGPRTCCFIDWLLLLCLGLGPQPRRLPPSTSLWLLLQLPLRVLLLPPAARRPPCRACCDKGRAGARAGLQHNHRGVREWCWSNCRGG